jgi:hypothetical protein
MLCRYAGRAFNGVLGSNTFTFGVSATADTAVPGAIWMGGGKATEGGAAASENRAGPGKSAA